MLIFRHNLVRESSMLCLIPGSVHGEVEAVLVDVVVNPEEVLQDVSHGLS